MAGMHKPHREKQAAYSKALMIWQDDGAFCAPLPLDEEWRDFMDHIAHSFAGFPKSIALKNGLQDADANDIEGKTWLKIGPHIRRILQGKEVWPERLPAWLAKVAGNLVKDFRKWESRHPTAPFIDGDHADLRTEQRRQETIAIIEKMLAELPKKQAVIFHLKLRGLSNQEIALRLGRSVRTVCRRWKDMGDYLRANYGAEFQ
jgi:RNA polymerase sigma factor (sigma-70 family)